MSEKNVTARTSDMDRYAVESLDVAEGVLSQFWHPEFGVNESVSLTDIALDVAAQNGLDASDPEDQQLALGAVRKVLKERVCNNMTRHGEVYLDLSNEYPANKRWMACDLKQVRFGQIVAADRLLNEHTDNRRYIAVLFDPEFAGRRFKQDRYDETVTLELPDVFDPSGYVAIVGVYGTFDEMEDAKSELAHAVNTIANPLAGTALEDDPVRGDDEPRSLNLKNI